MQDIKDEVISRLQRDLNENRRETAELRSDVQFLLNLCYIAMLESGKTIVIPKDMKVTASDFEQDFNSENEIIVRLADKGKSDYDVAG